MIKLNILPVILENEFELLARRKDVNALAQKRNGVQRWRQLTAEENGIARDRPKFSVAVAILSGSHRVRRVSLGCCVFGGRNRRKIWGTADSAVFTPNGLLEHVKAGDKNPRVRLPKEP